MHVISLGVATVEAKTKAEAIRRARAGDFDSYELHAPNASITSLGEGAPIATSVLRPVDRPVVFKS